jgi:hypothetical protein
MTAFPQYSSVTAFRIPQGNSNYHSFTIEATKRYSQGLNLQFSFTGGKLLDDVSSTVGFLGATGGKQDFYNRQADKSISAQDVSRRIVIAFNYELPFGRNRAFGSGMSKPLDFVLGGWQINGILTSQSGLPLAINNGGNNTQIFAPGQRANSTGISGEKSGPISERLNANGEVEYFNPAAYSQAGNFTFGNLGRFLPDIRGPRQDNLDFSVFKMFKFRERLQTTFRAEAFNATNHPIWNNPGLTVNDPGNFGITRLKGGNARQIQLALKVNF